MPVELDTGYEALRGDDFITSIRDEYETLLSGLGIPYDLGWDRDYFLGQITAIVGVAIGDLSEGTQLIYDQFSLNNATGVQVDDLLQIVGLKRRDAFASRVTVTITGTPSTVIPLLSQIRGGGIDDNLLWEIDESVIIGGGGTVSALFVATETGPLPGAAGTVDDIVTPVTGWDSVTNPTDATLGDDIETDTEAKLRRADSLSIGGGNSTSALRAALMGLSGISAAVVLDNKKDYPVTNNGVYLLPHSVAVIIYPNSLTTAEKQSVADTIYRFMPVGIQLNGEDEEISVIKANGQAELIVFNYAGETEITVSVAISAETGYTEADFYTTVQGIVEDYFDSLSVGQPARRLAINKLIAEVVGIASSDILLDGIAADAVPSFADRLVIDGSVVVS